MYNSREQMFILRPRLWVLLPFLIPQMPSFAISLQFINFIQHKDLCLAVTAWLFVFLMLGMFLIFFLSDNISDP